MPKNGHLNQSQQGGEKGYFWTLKIDFPVFLILGSVEGRRGRKILVIALSVSFLGFFSYIQQIQHRIATHVFEICRNSHTRSCRMSRIERSSAIFWKI